MPPCRRHYHSPGLVMHRHAVRLVRQARSCNLAVPPASQHAQWPVQHAHAAPLTSALGTRLSHVRRVLSHEAVTTREASLQYSMQRTALSWLPKDLEEDVAKSYLVGGVCVCDGVRTTEAGSLVHHASWYYICTLLSSPPLYAWVASWKATSRTAASWL